MRIVADLHIHSKYSRATSPTMDLDTLSKWAKWKGITVMGTGDFTHPLWFRELQQKLKPAAEGLYQFDDVYYMLTVELNHLFYIAGKAKTIHNLVFVPTLQVAEKLNKELSRFGDLMSDGRPLIRLEAKKLVEIALAIDPTCMIVPAHAWTPHFAIFGSNGGFDSLEECFGERTKDIHAIETGLSSDPAMNWRWSDLDGVALISNSDSHSAPRIGREANALECELSYQGITEAIKSKDPKRFLMTVEFFPEEGKYHYDGHRNCKSRLDPEETIRRQYRCPVCGSAVTVGVMHRVQKLSDRPVGYKPANPVPFKNLIPLQEIIADAKGIGVGTAGAAQEYHSLIQRLGTEFHILLEAEGEQIRKFASPKVAEGILRVREGKVKIQPGYDGEYGKISIFGEEEKQTEKQMTLF